MSRAALLPSLRGHSYFFVRTDDLCHWGKRNIVEYFILPRECCSAQRCLTYLCTGTVTKKIIQIDIIQKKGNFLTTISLKW